MKRRDYYSVLSVPRSASRDEIKKAYKGLAKKHHPDRNAGDRKAEERFKEVSEAYRVLSNDKKRREYDLFGHGGRPEGNGFQGWGHGTQPHAGDTGSAGPDAHGFHHGDMGGDPGDIGEIFSRIFGGGGHRKSGPGSGFQAGTPFDFGMETGPASGADVEADIHLDFEEAIRGGTHRLSLRRDGACSHCLGSGRNRSGKTETCRACNGSGGKQVGNAGTHFSVMCTACGGEGRTFVDPCTPCRGTGRSEGVDTLSVNIPAGVEDGGRLRIPGKGQAGPSGRAGDLFLRIHVRPHRFFRRKGADLHVDLPLTVSEAVLGATVEVPTLEGPARLKIPAATQNGAVLRMKGKGIASPRQSGHGDMFVRVNVAVPQNLDGRARNLFEELRKTEHNPREGAF